MDPHKIGCDQTICGCVFVYWNHRQQIVLQINESSSELTEPTADDPVPAGPPDSHEAMNNRELNPKLRRKRSFEFLLGLINNNSKYEVVRSDPALSANKDELQKNKTNTLDATSLLIELLTKIVSYPEHWRKIHQVLRSLDEDLISSQHILQAQMDKQNLYSRSQDIKRKINASTANKSYQQQSSSTEPNKWPTFDDYEGTTEQPTTKRQTESLDHRQTLRFIEKSSYQKNFAYHKVTGKPTHLKKNPTAYIAVSALSEKPSRSEDYMLETELHRLKPWKNKNQLKV